jgi:hypothetical protein
MSDATPNEPGLRSARPAASGRRGFWLTELPYGAVFILTISGVAYTSYAKQPISTYWQLLAPLIGAVCVGSGWRKAGDRDERLRLIVTQAFHWLAFVVAMNLMLLPDIQLQLTANASGLAILLLLALGTFTAGVHALAWQVCVLGLFMAGAVPALAWFERSAFLWLLAAGAVIGIGVAILWAKGGGRSAPSRSEA